MKRRLLIAALFFLLFLTGCNNTSHNAVIYMRENSVAIDNVFINTTGKKLAEYK